MIVYKIFGEGKNQGEGRGEEVDRGVEDLGECTGLLRRRRK